MANSAWGVRKSSTPKPTWDGDLDAFDGSKMYSGTGENPEPISLKVPTALKRAMSIAFDNKIDGYETMSDLQRDMMTKGLWMILNYRGSAEAMEALEAHMRWQESEAKVKRIDTWRRVVDRRKTEVENITDKTELAAWVLDCEQDARYMTGKCQEDMLKLIERHG